ncbi:MAG TPA: acyl-CoA dehydrogenase family protein [Anaeromyxobacter sp.]
MRAGSELSRPEGRPPGEDDSGPVAASVERFCRETIDPRVERPELVVPGSELARIAAGAREAGILPSPGAPGFALWEDAREAGALARSLAILERLGESCAGIAFHLHRVSLAARVARETRIVASNDPALHLGGMGWDGLAELLSGGSALPAAALDGEPLLVHAAEPWDELWMAAVDGAEPCWLRLPRPALRVAAVAGQHGLDEMPLWEVRVPRASAERAVARGEPARRILADALCISALGMVAMALGAARHGLRLARAHAAARRQGGASIREHPAVQQLLGEAAAAVATVAAALGGVNALPSTVAGLAQALGLRATAHRLLCESANASLQIMGGMGYMRDAGAEKIVRDENHLRLLEGSPSELWRFIARAEGQP